MSGIGILPPVSFDSFLSFFLPLLSLRKISKKQLFVICIFQYLTKKLQGLLAQPKFTFYSEKQQFFLSEVANLTFVLSFLLYEKSNTRKPFNFLTASWFVFFQGMDYCNCNSMFYDLKTVFRCLLNEVSFTTIIWQITCNSVKSFSKIQFIVATSASASPAK